MAPMIEELKTHFPDILAGAPGLRVEMLSGDASSRRYFRITAEDKNYVLQEDLNHAKDVSSEKHPYLSALRLFQKTVGHIPEYFGHSAEKGWILLEDLGNTTLQQEPSEGLYLGAVELSAKIILGHEELSSDFIEKYEGPHFSWAFDEEKLGQEMQHTATHLIEFYCGEESEKFLELIAPTVKYLAARPRYFVHRDYHCRNLMVSGGKLWLIDFQDARKGPISYDIVSLLWDPYLPLTSELRSKLLDHWKNSLGGLKAQTQTTDFEEELERMKIQRLLKAAGSYASFLKVKGRTDYLPSIKPALEAAHQALLNLKKIGVMRDEDAGLLTMLKSLKREDSAIIGN